MSTLRCQDIPPLSGLGSSVSTTSCFSGVSGAGTSGVTLLVSSNPDGSTGGLSHHMKLKATDQATAPRRQDLTQALALSLEHSKTLDRGNLSPA